MLEAGEPLAAAAGSLGSATAPQRSWRLPLLAPDILDKAPIAANAKGASEIACTAKSVNTPRWRHSGNISWLPVQCDPCYPWTDVRGIRMAVALTGGQVSTIS